MLNLAEKIFSYFVQRRNVKFDNNKNFTFTCKVPVISVGNLSVGGTGKTPFVIFLCNYLKNNGYKPCVIGRGYKRKGNNAVIVSDGNNILVPPEIGGDEMLLIAQKCNVPVVVHSKKYIAAQIAEQKFNIDCIIVDDGFQHRKLNRNLDIVLIDNQTINNPFLIPKGRLREPFSSLKRADIICLTKSATINNFNKLYSQNIPVIETQYKLALPYPIDNFPTDNINIENLKKNIIAFAGIAQPNNFFEMLKCESYNVIKSISFDDHHNYVENDIVNLIETAQKHNCNIFATTEKDATKISQFPEILMKSRLQIYVFPVETILCENSNLLTNKIKNMFMNFY